MRGRKKKENQTTEEEKKDGMLGQIEEKERKRIRLQRHESTENEY